MNRHSDLPSTLADGRSLDVRVAGPEDGSVARLASRHAVHRPPVPLRSSRRPSARGIRLVTYSRPGYAGSTREGRSVADCAARRRRIVDHLGADRFATMGQSGGGPHTLACAALLPDRVIACATIAGVGPWDAEGLDFLEGMAQENIEELGAALEGAEALRAFLETRGRESSGERPADEVARMPSAGSSRRRRQRGGRPGSSPSTLAAMFHEAVRDRHLGLVRRRHGVHRVRGGSTWRRSGSRCRVWQGAQDLMVPFAHGEWLAAHVPMRRRACSTGPRPPLARRGLVRRDPRRPDGRLGGVSVATETNATSCEIDMALVERAAEASRPPRST